MTRPRLILLPGLHGTGELFTPLLPLIQPELRPKIISYPTDQLLGYDQLLGLIEAELAHEPQIVLLAESFSGPLAIRYATRRPLQVRALILCATFVRSPIWPPVVSMFSFFVGSPPPKRVLRWLLLGRDAPRPTCRWVQKAIGRVDSRVIAHRLQQVQRLDISDELARCRAPILYLQASHDRIVHPSNLTRMLDVQPSVVRRTLPGPHMLLQVAPLAAWGHIAEFSRTWTEPRCE